jgi:FkbM family methyltransferase
MPLVDSALTLPVHAARLHANGTLKGIAPGASPILMEIGTSDRNTLDLELLPKLPSAFLVSFEPLLEKFARAISRRESQASATDKAEPLGKHHARGMILPLAIGPTANGSESNGEFQTFHVAGNAGCSSLLPSSSKGEAGQHFAPWCKNTVEKRRVWVVPLSRALAWVDRDVDFLKVDAQGADLSVLLSGGELLSRRVRRLALEVVADECAPLYSGQPRCSEVVAALTKLGYEPPWPPLRCRTKFPFHANRHPFCEMDLLFERRDVQQSSRAQQTAPRPLLPSNFLAFEERGPHGCDEVYNSSNRQAVQALRASPPADRALALFQHPVGVAYYSGSWEGKSPHPRGLPVICPSACFFQNDERHAADLWASTHERTGRCPW